MLFKEIIPVYTESHTKHKYKMQTYWLLIQMVYIFTTRPLRVNDMTIYPDKINTMQIRRVGRVPEYGRQKLNSDVCGKTK
jgi:hypothetical protein